MPYCQKCGFQVSEQMQFCPRCGASLMPLTVQRRGHWYRVTSYIIPQSLFFVFFAFFSMLSMNVSTHVSLSSQILWIASGIVGGVFIGVAVTQRQLNSLAGKGETGRTIPAIPTLLFILGSCFVLAALFLVALPITILLTAMYGVFNFVFCAGIAFIL